MGIGVGAVEAGPREPRAFVRHRRSHGRFLPALDARPAVVPGRVTAGQVVIGVVPRQVAARAVIGQVAGGGWPPGGGDQGDGGRR